MWVENNMSWPKLGSLFLKIKIKIHIYIYKKKTYENKRIVVLNAFHMNFHKKNHYDISVSALVYYDH